LAVGRSRNLRCVRNRDDRTKTFRGLSVGHDLAVRCVDTRVVGVISIAGLESVVLGVVWGIECAANTVKDVFAIVGSIGSRRITGLEAESIPAHEVGPLHDLNVLTGPNVRKDHTTHRVTAEISTVGVHFTSVIVGSHIDLGLVKKTNDLDVIGSFQILDTGNGFGRNKTCTMPSLCTPGNHLAFYFTDSFAWFWRSPEAEITRAINVSCLAKGILVFSGRITDVISELDATNEPLVCVNLVRKLIWRGIVF